MFDHSIECLKERSAFMNRMLEKDHPEYCKNNWRKELEDYEKGYYNFNCIKHGIEVNTFDFTIKVLEDKIEDLYDKSWSEEVEEMKLAIKILKDNEVT